MSFWGTQTVQWADHVCALQMRVYWMRAPACSSFKSLQKLCKWGFPLHPVHHCLYWLQSRDAYISVALFVCITKSWSQVLHHRSFSIVMPVRQITRTLSIAILSLCQQFVRSSEIFLLNHSESGLKCIGFFPKTFFPTMTKQFKRARESPLLPFKAELPFSVFYCVAF